MIKVPSASLRHRLGPTSQRQSARQARRGAEGASETLTSRFRQLTRTKADGFRWSCTWYLAFMASDTQRHIAMLRILLATCETALDAFHAADNPVDADFVEDLERITERTRKELAALVSASSA